LASDEYEFRGLALLVGAFYGCFIGLIYGIIFGIGAISLARTRASEAIEGIASGVVTGVFVGVRAGIVGSVIIVVINTHYASVPLQALVGELVFGMLIAFLWIAPLLTLASGVTGGLLSGILRSWQSSEKSDSKQRG
jgi:hypothetical protein